MDPYLSLAQSVACRPAVRNFVAFIALGMCACSGAWGSETRTYVISEFHTATYSNSDTCPKGGNGMLPDIQRRVLKGMGYTEEQLKKMTRGFSGTEVVDEKGTTIDIELRGQLDGKPANIATYPTSIPDPKIETAQGRYAYGFNLNGVIEPDSFKDPDSHTLGVDNQLWRVLGCFAMYSVRLPVVPYYDTFVWNIASDTMPAWLMSISGSDLSKDGEVKVSFDRALNRMARNARGEVLSGMTFTVDPNPRSHSSFNGRIKDGVLTIDPGPFAMLGDSPLFTIVRFSHTQLRLRLNADGSLSGLIGGYQPWMDVYFHAAVASEADAQVDFAGIYYALKRLADAEPDPTTKQMTAISAAYWIEAVPAYHTDANGKVLTVEATGPVSTVAASTR